MRRHTDVVSSGVRFCSIDRPGGGWSEPDPSATDFGVVAGYTHEAMTAMQAAGKIGSKIVLLFHSLGGCTPMPRLEGAVSLTHLTAPHLTSPPPSPSGSTLPPPPPRADHALALAEQLKSDSSFEIVGAVAADALSPSWHSWKTPTTAATCSTSAPIDCAGWRECSFWRLVRFAEPSGLVRLLYASGVGGFDSSIKAFPVDTQSIYLANAMKPNYFGACDAKRLLPFPSPLSLPLLPALYLPLSSGLSPGLPPALSLSAGRKSPPISLWQITYSPRAARGLATVAMRKQGRQSSQSLRSCASKSTWYR